MFLRPFRASMHSVRDPGFRFAHPGLNSYAAPRLKEPSLLTDSQVWRITFSHRPKREVSRLFARGRGWPRARAKAYAQYLTSQLFFVRLEE